MEEEIIDALTLSEKNPLYAEYLQKKDVFIKKQQKKIFSQKHKDTEEKEYVYKDDSYDLNALLFLSFATRKYFNDCAVFSALKILLGIASIVVAACFERFGHSNSLTGIVMTVLFGYGLIQIPLAIMICIANLIAKGIYLKYVSTYTSKVANAIRHFYDPETDKFHAVTFRAVIKDHKAFHEQRRMRGW